MFNKKINWGILGTAWIAKERVIPAIHMAKNSNLLAISSRSIEKSEQIASDYAIPKAYGSYEDLLSDPEIEAVYIPLPNQLHAEWTIRAAEAGKHVLCEKPVALSVKEMTGMLEACRKNNVHLMEAFAFRSHPKWKEIVELIRGGNIGEVRTVQARYSIMVENKNDIRLNNDLGGGVLNDLGSYCVNAIRLIMDSDPMDVKAFAVFNEDKVDISLVASLKFSGERLAQFDCTFESEYNQTLEISGTEGVMKIKFPFQYPELTIIKDGMEQKKAFEKHINPYVNQIEHFSSSISSNIPLCYSPEEAVFNMKTLEAIKTAIRS